MFFTNILSANFSAYQLAFFKVFCQLLCVIQSGAQKDIFWADFRHSGSFVGNIVQASIIGSLQTRSAWKKGFS